MGQEKFKARYDDRIQVTPVEDSIEIDLTSASGYVKVYGIEDGNPLRDGEYFLENIMESVDNVMTDEDIAELERKLEQVGSIRSL